MKRIAVIGGGPAGLEAALYARRLGHKAVVYEKENVGEAVRSWGHVAMFSPWRENVSALAMEELRGKGWTPPDLDAFPTGREFRERYLHPLAEVESEAVQSGMEVVGVARAGLLKGDGATARPAETASGSASTERSSRPFRILLKKRSIQELWAEADVVIDASGVFTTPNFMGDGGLPAVGERVLRKAIDYQVPDVLGADRARFHGKGVLVVGDGFSAASSIVSLVRLQSEEPKTRLTWAFRSAGPDPVREVAADPLPRRAALAREANRVARERPGGLGVISGMMVEKIDRSTDRFRVHFRSPQGAKADVVVDRIIANVGFRPNHDLSRELQTSFSYFSEGCRASAGGPERLPGAAGSGTPLPAHPDPGFFVIGQKGRGRGGEFVLRDLRDDVREVFRVVEGKPDLDLYGSRQSTVDG